jgi:hypothetical protein
MGDLDKSNNNDSIDESNDDSIDESNNDSIDEPNNDNIDDESNNDSIDEPNNDNIDESKNDELDKFDQLVKKNKDSGEHWYHGLNGKWWWGLPEDQVRNKIASGQYPKEFDQTHNRHRVAVASIIRNEERSGRLKKFFDCCQRLEEYDDVVYIFIEGDSSDNTYIELQDWLSTKDNYILKKIDRRKPRFPKDKNSSRTKYFAKLRNILIGYTLSISDISEVLMIDANYGWKGDLISSLRGTKADIAAPLVVMNKNSNGKYAFYDTWAFRKDGMQFSHDYPYIGYSKLDKPVSVDSVGGGYLIKRKVLEANVKYNGDRDCEHCGFCQKARKKGFSIKINPKVYIMKGGLK